MLRQYPKSQSYRIPLTFSALAHTTAFALLFGMAFIPILHKTITIGISSPGGPIILDFPDATKNTIGDPDLDICINNPPPTPLPAMVNPTPLPVVDEAMLYKSLAETTPQLTPKSAPTATPARSTKVAETKPFKIAVAAAQPKRTPDTSLLPSDIVSKTNPSHLLPVLGAGFTDGGISAPPPSIPGLAADVQFPQEYCIKARALFQANFILPQNMATVAPVECIVEFRIARDGTLSNVRVVPGKGTGKASFDRYAVDAVQKTARLDPFPLSIKEDYVTATIPFGFGQ
ncbi:TPA: hypothetical protein DDW35_08365 [Candidatus Sumerlaeota bacterium]|nr:hypothetical protein [Candidatus Sumerlaeota bacterium]